jgi:diaminopimelate epimerase
MKRIKSFSFEKRHGLGNDFVVVWAEDLKSQGLSLSKFRKLCPKVCDRHFGVGADQVLILSLPKSKQKYSYDFRMQVLNADGSKAEMCGNGIRAALGSFCDRFHHRSNQRTYWVKSDAGRHELKLEKSGWITVGMGIPQFHGAIKILGQSGFKVSIGNPHFVIRSKNLKNAPVATLGPKIETHPNFPNKTNVEWVEVLSKNKIAVRVWERGAGITLACGTGACAAAAVAIHEKWVYSPVQVQLPGGELKIEWNPGNELKMSGPETLVFDGAYRFLADRKS